MNIEKGFKNTFNTEVLVSIILAILAIIASRLLHENLISKVNFLDNVPEVSDVVVALVGATALKGYQSKSVVIGAGVSFVNNIEKRAGVDFLHFYN